jgi:homogentisate 1,2-dioxygenase
MVTFHPCGFTHGPHPKAFAAGAKKRKDDDRRSRRDDRRRDPLDMSKAAAATEDRGYADSWKTK